MFQTTKGFVQPHCFSGKLWSNPWKGPEAVAGQGDPLSVRLASAIRSSHLSWAFYSPQFFFCFLTYAYRYANTYMYIVYICIYIIIYICLSVYLSIYLSFYLSVFLSIYLYIYIYIVEKEQTQEDKIYPGLKTHHSPRDQGLLPIRCCTDSGNPSLVGIHCRPVPWKIIWSGGMNMARKHTKGPRHDDWPTHHTYGDLPKVRQHWQGPEILITDPTKAVTFADNSEIFSSENYGDNPLLDYTSRIIYATVTRWDYCGMVVQTIVEILTMDTQKPYHDDHPPLWVGALWPLTIWRTVFERFEV